MTDKDRRQKFPSKSVTQRVPVLKIRKNNDNNNNKYNHIEQ
jgi:hypothetical protein